MTEITSLQKNLMRRNHLGDALRRSSKKYPDKVALVYYYPDGKEVQLAYKELNEKANRFAHALVELGIEKGDRVAVFAHSAPQYLICWYGLLKIGAILTPLNFMLRDKEISYVINHSKSKMFIAEDSLVETVQQVSDEMPSVKYYCSINITGKPKPDDWLDFDELYLEKYSDAEPEVEIGDDDIATLMYTSGTEAAPKGVMNTHKNYNSTATSFLLDAHIETPDVYLLPIPLYHVAGLILTTVFHFAGARVVLTYVPNPAQMMELIPKHKVNWLIQPPTLFAGMAQVPNFEKTDLSSMEKCMSFGALMHRPAIETWSKVAPHIHWWTYWGQSELSPLGITGEFDTIEDVPNQDLRWIGKPMCTLETKLVDDNDNEVPLGTVGEIVARSPSVMLGYYKNEEKTEEAFKSGWLHTGDLAMMDEDGNYYFIDRKKDIVKSGGENVSTYEVEDLIFKYPKVADVAVIGIPDPYWVEAVAAVIVPKAGEAIEEDEIISFCKNKLAGYKVPKRVFVTTEIPKNPSGKILKKDLRKQYEKEASKK